VVIETPQKKKFHHRDTEDTEKDIKKKKYGFLILLLRDNIQINHIKTPILSIKISVLSVSLVVNLLLR